jgi:response regulator RpfG family c-di-GMP phosphodiesterase
MFAPDHIEIRVLIVDDEPKLRSVLAEFISKSYQCVQVESAEAGLAEIKKAAFAVVIADVNLSGMSGLDMIPLIKAQSPQTVVVVVSGQQSLDDSIKALRMGAFDYIVKPLDLNQVETAIHRAVEHYELQIIKRRYNEHLERMVAERTIELDRALEDIESSYRATLKALVQALETRDHETHGHSERVVTFSLRLGYELCLGQEQLRALEFGALLHDIGKIGVPDAILRKPASLTDDEWLTMQLHPQHGEQILRNIPFLAGATKVVSQHHEKWNGSGYPLGLKADEIDLNARIFAVVDAFDAIVSDRVYRIGQTYEEACRKIKKSIGIQFDPDVVAAFLRIPKEDWETLHERSLQSHPEHLSFRDLVVELMNERANNPQQKETEKVSEKVFEPALELQ